MAADLHSRLIGRLKKFVGVWPCLGAPPRLLAGDGNGSEVRLPTGKASAHRKLTEGKKNNGGRWKMRKRWRKGRMRRRRFGGGIWRNLEEEKGENQRNQGSKQGRNGVRRGRFEDDESGLFTGPLASGLAGTGSGVDPNRGLHWSLSLPPPPPPYRTCAGEHPTETPRHLSAVRPNIYYIQGR